MRSPRALRALRALTLRHALALTAVLVATVAGGGFAFARLVPRPAAAARPPAVEVVRGSIASTVTATGSVATPAQSKLGFKSSGRLAELLIKVGDQVAAGQPLARIDDGDLQVALVQAQANLSSAVAKLE